MKEEDHFHDKPSMSLVTRKVIEQFCSALSEQEDLKEASENLKKLILDDGVMSEAAIKSALLLKEK